MGSPKKLVQFGKKLAPLPGKKKNINGLKGWVNLLLWILPWCMEPQNALAQQESDSLQLKHESMRQGINTFSFSTHGDYRLPVGTSGHLEAQSGQYTIYNRALEQNRFITQNVWNRFAFRKAIHPSVSWHNEAWQYSYFANETRIAQFQSKIRYHLLRQRLHQMYVEGAGGFANDKRLNNNNAGLKAEGLLAFEGISADSGTSYRLQGFGSQIQLNPRQNQRLSASGGIIREFPGGGLLALDGAFLRSKVEDYLSNDIQSIVSDTAQIKVRLRIPIAKGIYFSTENELQTPNRAFFYRNKETGAETRNVRYFQDEYQSLNAIRFQRKRLQINLSLESKLRNRTYDILNRLNAEAPDYQAQLISFNQKLKDERIKDIREQFTTWNLDGRIRLGKNHSLRVNYVAQLLRVDTRSELNNQDRDEILYASEGSHEWTLPFGFRLTNKLSGSLRHLIFIEASQSSENYIDRILRWEPSVRWNNRFFTWTSQMGIWATYQVRDFESQKDKNRSNRVLIFNHNLDTRIHKRWHILAEALRRENRLSQLNWERFSESPIDTVTLHDLAARLQWLSRTGKKTNWALQLGYRAFWQVRKSKGNLTDPAGTVLIFLRSYFVQQGPQMKFQISANDRLRVQGEFWLQRSSQYFRYKKGEGGLAGTSFSPEQLSVREDRWLPFFSVQGVWILKKK